SATTTSVQLYLGTARNWYVSSPVSNAKAPSGYTYYQRDEAGASWTSMPFVATNTFTPGRGYIALPSAPGATLTFTAETGGILNTGNVTVPLTYAGATSKGFNLIGNPYPSHLTWTKAFVDEGTNAALIESSIYYRTNAGTVNSGGDAAWSNKTYNSFAQVGSPSGTTNVIPPMQAFWVRSKAAGSLILNSNLTRSHQASNPLRAAEASKNADRQQVRLEVSNGTSTPDEALLYFDVHASNDFDGYDSPKMTNGIASVPEIYTLAGAEQLVINGLNSISANMELPLGFRTGQPNTFTIRAKEVTNLDVGTKLILKDNVLGTEQDLTDGSAYGFTSDVVATDTRFTLLFKLAGGISGIGDSKADQYVLVSKNANNQITVHCKGGISSNATVKVYSIYGLELLTQTITTANTVLGMVFTSGVYLVNVNNGGTNTTQKLLINQ
ncbi:MAG: T9SS type A sorting domain-containing protein, partial [Bacteroidia bacterium]|nr:T9SS type A sorting domain-containing protein [Bacteroidia bacterium]